MFAQFNFGDPQSEIRDAIGDHLEAALAPFVGISIVGRLAGWGSWADEATGERYHEQSGSVQFLMPDSDKMRDVVEAIASEAAAKFEQDAVAVLFG